jgi:putative NADH-flavin reductase
MIVTVFGATGLVGRQVVRQALAKNFEVRAFGRNIEQFIDLADRNKNLRAIKGYVFDEHEVFDAVNGSDAVISVLGGSFDGKDKTRSLGLRNIARQMEQAGVKRIIALGGMGGLNADENTLIIDKPDYPAMYLPVGREHQKAFEYLSACAVDWTFICAPDIIDNDANGRYVTNANYLPVPNYYKISAGNLASFMLSEITDNKYVHQRVGISNK